MGKTQPAARLEFCAMRSLFLPPKKAERIHEATLRVLEHTGLEVEHRGAEQLLLNAGAKKDGSGRILLPPSLVNESIEKARARGRLQLFDRDGNKGISLQQGKTYFGPGGDARYNLDARTGVFRQSLLSDVAENVAVVDALPGFDFAMTMALPSDVPHQKVYPAAFAKMVANTTKPVVATAISLEDVQRIHRIASIAAGGKQALRERPFLIMLVDPISPLRMDAVGTRKLLYCAEQEVPVLYAAGANCGASAPVTPEGGVVQGSAECLAGLVLAMLKNERAPFIYGSSTSAMDMSSGVISYGDPIWFKTVAMYADLARYYDLSSWGTAGSADSMSVDAQAAMEAYEGITFVLLAGTSLAHDVGFLGHGELYDPRMLVFCDMMIARARHILRPANLSDEALAVDVIDEVARHERFYASHPHTMEHFRAALWMPPAYLDRKHLSEFRFGDLPTLLRQEVHRILTTHRPTPLTEDKAAAIRRFLASF